MSKKEDLLAKVSLFSLLKESDLGRIAGLTSDHLFHEGEIIIREGDQDRRLFIITSGEVEVMKGLGFQSELRIRALGPHSYFGEMSLVDELPRSASVVAKEETEVLCLDHLDLRREIEKHPTIALELMKTMSRRIREIEEATRQTLRAYLLME